MTKALFSGMTATSYDAAEVEKVLRADMGSSVCAHGLHGSLFPVKRRCGEISSFMSPDGLSGGVLYASGVATQPAAHEVIIRRRTLNGPFYSQSGLQPVSEALIHTHTPSYRLYVAVHESIHVVTDHIWGLGRQAGTWVDAYCRTFEKEQVADAGAVLYVLSNFDGKAEKNHLVEEACAWRGAMPCAAQDTAAAVKQARAEYQQEEPRGLSLGDAARWALNIVPRGVFNEGDFFGLAAAEHMICDRLRSVSQDQMNEIAEKLDEKGRARASSIYAQKIGEALAGRAYLVQHCNV